MHYIHKLTPRQKRSLITVFVITPILFLILLSYLWMKNHGIFIDTFQIKTVVSSAQGVAVETPVSFSGIKIGWITDLSLNEEDRIEVTMKIDKNYQDRIRQDSHAIFSALGIIGKMVVRIKGGSRDSPLVQDGDFLESVESLEVESLVDKISPMIKAAEKSLLKLERIISNFPEEKFNSTIENLYEISTTLEKGDSTLGRLASTDSGQLYADIEQLIARLNEISVTVKKASDSLPSAVESTGTILGNAEKISESAKEAAKALPEMQKKLSSALAKLDSVLGDIAEMTPDIKKDVESVSVLADEFNETVMPKIPGLLDDVEEALNETLLLLQSVKSSWPFSGMVQPEKKLPAVEPSLRETPYPPGSAP